MPTPTKLQFKSEKERSEALMAVPEVDDAPLGTDLEEYRLEIEQRINDINSADIVSEDGEGQSQPQFEEDQPTQSVNNEQQEPAQRQAPQNSEIELLKAQNERLQEERNDIESSYKARLDEFEAKIKKLESGTSTNTQSVHQETNTEREISTIEKQIATLEREMNQTDDVYDEDYIKKIRQQNSLNTKLNRLVNQRHSEEMKRHREELATLKTEQKLEKETSEKEENEKAIISKIEKFRESKPEFQGKAYSVMAEEYTEFAKKVGQVWFGRDVTNGESEIAMDKYLDGVPALTEAIKSRGVKEPEDLRKYITLSEISATKMGYRLNKASGKWEKIKDEFGNDVNLPTFESAYEYMKGSTRGRDLLEAQNRATKNLQKAINTRANPVELQDDHSPGDTPNDMTKEQAHNVLNTFDEEKVEIKRRMNSNDPMVVEYNKALKTLGHSPLADD